MLLVILLGSAFVAGGLVAVVQSVRDTNRASRERSVSLAVVLSSIGILLLVSPWLSDVVFVAGFSAVGVLGSIAYFILLKRNLRRSRKGDPEWFAKMRSFQGFLVMGFVMFLAAGISYLVHFHPFQSLWIVGILMVLAHIWKGRVIRRLDTAEGDSRRLSS